MSTPTTFTSTLLEAVDRLDIDGFLARLTPDVVVTFGNSEPLRGQGAVRQMLNGHFATVAHMHHRVVAEHWSDDVLVQELIVTLERKNGKAATVPGVNVLRLEGDLVRDYRVYIDLSAAPAD